MTRLSRPRPTVSALTVNQLRDRYQAGDSVEQLARLAGISTHGVTKILVGAGVKLRQPGWPPRKAAKP